MPKTNQPPAFLLYVDDFASDGKVEAMTTEQVGAYILLLCKSWRENPPGSIPTDDCVLARWARLTPDRWSACRAGVLAAFTLGTDSRWHQKRLREEYAKLQSRRASAKQAAELRWNQTDACERNANAMRTQCSSSSSSNQKQEKPGVRGCIEASIEALGPTHPNQTVSEKTQNQEKTSGLEQSQRQNLEELRLTAEILGREERLGIRDEARREVSAGENKNHGAPKAAYLEFIRERDAGRFKGSWKDWQAATCRNREGSRQDVAQAIQPEVKNA